MLRRIRTATRIALNEGFRSLIGHVGAHVARWGGVCEGAGPASLRVFKWPNPDWRPRLIDSAAAPLNLHFIVPDFARGGGGHMTIFRIAHYLERFGHCVTIWVDGSSAIGSPPAAGAAIRDWFMPLEAEVRYLCTAADPSLIEGDAVIATAWQTAYAARAVERVRQKFYFVQDFEPAFSPLGTTYLLAEQTYRFGFVCLTAGPWLAELLAASYGCRAYAFDLAVDRQHYFVDPALEREALHVAFYARDTTQRRAVELGLEALNVAAAEEPRLRVHLFGGVSGRRQVRFAHVDHGVLDSAELGQLYRQCTAGVVFSASNYSLVPAEMMACGLPVLELETQCTKRVFPPGAVTLAQPDPRQIATRLLELLRDATLRNRQARAALAYVEALDWEKSARAVEAGLFAGLRSAATHPAGV